ncbi:MAG TPA: DUF2303 family protein [Thermoleophilaceae bacterium]|nr:DUF2303 family protein [Thermoleophilaceae bacterium]
MSDAQAVIDNALMGAEPEVLDPSKQYGIIVPANATHRVVDLEKFLPVPNRARATYKPSTVDAFMEVVDRLLEEGATTIWVDEGKTSSGSAGATVVAVLNDNAEKAGWGDHRVELALKPSAEWERWLKLNGRFIKQLEFAEHIDRSLLDIANPDGAELLEIVQSIEGTETAAFKSTRRLDNGARGFRYEADIEASAGQEGELEVPTEFGLVLATFVGEVTQPVTAKLRYRIRGGELLMGYDLVNLDKILEDAVRDITGRISEKFDGKAPVYRGTARSATTTSAATSA